MEILTAYWDGESSEHGKYVQVVDMYCNNGFSSIILEKQGTKFIKPVPRNTLHHLKRHSINSTPDYLE